MKAAFVNDKIENIDLVYSPETQNALLNMFDFFEGVYTKAQAAALKETECIFTTWGFPAFTEEEIKTIFPNLKIVFYGAGSVQYFARPFLNCGIKVVSAWMANSVPVVEYTVSQIILANKGFFRASALCTSLENRQKSYAYFKSFSGNYNTKVGLLGLGAIGAGVAERLKDYEINVYAYDPFVSEEKAKALQVKMADLSYIFENCQTISNHIANIPETVGMLDYSLFSKMRKNATFINTGRGAQVVEQDLVRALTEEPDRTALLDVTWPEPCPEGHPFYNMENVFLTPHMAGSSNEECKRMGAYMAEEAERYLKSEPLSYQVTLKMLETMA